ncbi:MAG: 16S rRNA (cytosine(967)-C(5))-methyltransferase RsmB [Xanthomonadales bacterium]|nr:16S rRNA (cytosine(967)-C(5))-methyltransferase RsmB [Xanthomonadales bacterium]
MSNARVAAARAIAGMLEGRSLDQMLGEQALDPDQRPFALALAFACARHLGSARALLQKLLSHPNRARPASLDAIVLCGLSELRHLATPDHAAVAETVAAARRLGLQRQAGMVNALLRRYLRERSRLDASVASDPTAASEHPGWWIEQLRHDWSDHADAILCANNQRAPLWLRVNRRRGSRQAMLDQLSASGLNAEAHPLLDDALRIDPPRPVEQIPGFLDGRLSVQDAAAQRVADWVQPQPGQRILDACAAPGGKTAHLLERCPDAQVWALDIAPERLSRVQENLDRLGLEAKLICANAADTAHWWDGKAFDRILVDAPCSGSGVVRRHPDIKWLRRASDLAQLSATQGELLRKLWPLLAPGGRLVYGTCSVFRCENQRVIADFLEEVHRAGGSTAHLWQPSEPVPGSAEAAPGLQILPGERDEDGFYYAALERR